MEDQPAVGSVVMGDEHHGAARGGIAGLRHDVPGGAVRQRAPAKPERPAAHVVVDRRGGGASHKRGRSAPEQRREGGHGVQQAERPPVAAAPALLLHPDSAAARGAELAREPVGRAALALRRRGALVGSKLAHDALDQGLAGHGRRQITQRRRPPRIRSAPWSSGGCRTAGERARADPGPRRCGSVMRRSNFTKSVGIARQLEGKRVGPGLNRPRQRIRRYPEAEPRQRHGQGDRRQPGRCAQLAARKALGEGLREERPGGRHQREPREAAQQVVVLLVAELVGHHHAHLVARELVDQVVVEDHPLAVAEADHVRVRRAGPAARVDPVDLAHVHPGPVGQLEHVAAQLARLQLVELVEDRVDHDRVEPDGHDPVGDHEHGARRPPVAREPAHERDRDQPADGGRHGAYAGALDHVDRPVRPGLCGQPHVEGALAHPGADREARDHEQERRFPLPQRRLRAAAAPRGGRAGAWAGARRAPRACRSRSPARRGPAPAGGCENPRPVRAERP